MFKVNFLLVINNYYNLIQNCFQNDSKLRNSRANVFPSNETYNVDINLLNNNTQNINENPVKVTEVLPTNSKSPLFSVSVEQLPIKNLSQPFVRHHQQHLQIVSFYYFYISYLIF